MASYLQGYVLLSIACNIGALFVVLYFMYFQKTNREEIKNLYNNCSKPNARGKKIMHNETFSIFFTSIFTAWVSPCSVWSVYYLYKTHFLLVSSTITCLCQLVNIISIYCYINLYSDISGDTRPPLTTHCFTNITFNDLENISNSTFISWSICDLDECKPYVRVCEEGEKPCQLFNQFIGPIGFSLIGITFLASLCLQKISDYQFMYIWSKKLACCCSPIITFTFLQDRLELPYDCKDFAENLEQNTEYLHQTDYLKNFTLLHLALRDESLSMAIYLINLHCHLGVQNCEGETCLQNLKNKIEKVEKNEGESESTIILRKYLKKLEHLQYGNDLAENQEELIKQSRVAFQRVWGEPPIHHLATCKNFDLLWFLTLLGADLSAYNGQGKNVFEICSEHFDDISEITSHGSWFCRSFFLRAAKSYLANKGSASLDKVVLGKAIEVLHQQKSDLDCVETKDAISLIHIIIEHGLAKQLALVLTNKIDVNCKNQDNKTPLQVAALTNSKISLELLTLKDIDINAIDNDGNSSLLNAFIHFVSHISDSCLEIMSDNALPNINEMFSLSIKNEELCRILIEKGADVNVKNKKGESPLRIAAVNVEEMYKGMKQNRPDLMIKYKGEDTDLLAAWTNQRKELCTLLIENHADMNVQRNSDTHLHIAEHKEIDNI